MSYYPSSSTYRNDDQLSSRYTRNQNFNSRQQSAQTTRNLSSQKHTTVMQQEQIADLERKIDLILMHNEKLESQKQRYKLMFQEIKCQMTQRALQSNTARFTSQQNQIVIEKLRKQLEVSSKTYERKLNQAYQSRQILKEQIQTLTKIVQDLNQQNRDLKLVIRQHGLKVQSLTFELKQQFLRQQIQLENKLRDQFLIRQVELKNQKKQMSATYQNQIHNLKSRFEKERQDLRKKSQQQIQKAIAQKQIQKQNLIKALQEQFQKEKEIIKLQNRQKLKEEQDNARQFIQANIDNVKQNDEQIKREYEQQINKLKQSLQARKKIINDLLVRQHASSDLKISEGNSKCQIGWFNQLLSLKQQLKQTTNQFLQESELLKLKLTEKFQIDVKMLKKIYEDKIQVMGQHNKRVEEQNSRLRDIYQKSLHSQIQMKKDFQLQKSKLKNIIRKLNVQLHGIQEQFKINIDGVKDQNNTFSMTMMKSMIQVKEKANFFSQQNRKLRKAYQEHQQEAISVKKHAQQQVEYYQSKYKQLKERLRKQITEYKQKIEVFQQQAQERQNNLRENLDKEHEMIHQVVEGLRNDIYNLTHENEELKKKCHDIQCTFKEKDEDIAFFKSRADQLQADIERLKMDLQMAGINDKDKADTINQWKNHYETTISQLEEQKSIINDKLLQKDQQLIQSDKRYTIIKSQIEKVKPTLNKKTTFEAKVIQMGLDINLVKNLAQIFSKGNP